MEIFNRLKLAWAVLRHGEPRYTIHLYKPIDGNAVKQAMLHSIEASSRRP